MPVWLTDINRVWVCAVIMEDYRQNRKQLVVQREGSDVTETLAITSTLDLPPLYDPEDMLTDKKKNFASLKNVHEAYLLHSLRLRFEARCLYNFCGVATVFLNPFTTPLTVTENDMMSWNHQARTVDDFEPHVLTVAQKAYRNLERFFHTI